MNALLGVMILWDYLLSMALAVCAGVFLAEGGFPRRKRREDKTEADKGDADARRPLTYSEALRAAQTANLWNYDGSEQTPADELARQMLYRAKKEKKGGGKR